MQITIDGIINSAIVAGREYLRLPRFWLESVRHVPLTRGGLRLPDPVGEEIRRISIGDPVTVVLGYRVDPGQTSSLTASWQGQVTWVKPGTEHQVEMGLATADAVLARARYTEAWMDETPEAILRRVLSGAGVKLGRIDSPGCVIPRFAVSNENIWQIAEKLELTCQRAFGLDLSAWTLWLDDTATAHWGDFNDPGQTIVPSVVTGENLIRHSPASDVSALGEIETFLLPTLRHSQLFRLHDMYRGVCDLFRAQRVRSEISSGKARTFIWYGLERSRY